MTNTPNSVISYLEEMRVICNGDLILHIEESITTSKFTRPIKIIITQSFKHCVQW